MPIERITKCIKFYSSGLLLLSTVLLIFFSVSNVNVKAQEWVVDCENTVNQNLCDCGFTGWLPATEFIKYNENGCLLEVRYQYRSCLCNPQIVEIEMIGIYFDMSYVDENGEPMCQYLFGYIDGLNPEDSTFDIAYVERCLYYKIIERNAQRQAQYLLNAGVHPSSLQLCPCHPNYDPNNPNHNPGVIHFFKRKGSCRGWCITQKPDINVLFDEYNWTPINPPPPSVGKYKQLNAEGLINLNNFMQTEVVPNISKDIIIGPIIEPMDAQFVWRINECTHNWCCVTAVRHCVAEYYKDANGKWVVVWNEPEITGYGNWPNATNPCQGYPSVTNCLPGSWVSVTSCKLICESSIPFNEYTKSDTSSVKEQSVTEIAIIPNPTHNGTTLTFTLLTSGNLTITLVDLEGKELIEIHNAKAEAGEFTKTFSMSKFPKGVYFIKINHNGNIKTEQIIRN